MSRDESHEIVVDHAGKIRSVAKPVSEDVIHEIALGPDTLARHRTFPQLGLAASAVKTWNGVYAHKIIVEALEKHHSEQERLNRTKRTLDLPQDDFGLRAAGQQESAGTLHNQVQHLAAANRAAHSRQSASHGNSLLDGAASGPAAPAAALGALAIAPGAAPPPPAGMEMDVLAAPPAPAIAAVPAPAAALQSFGNLLSADLYDAISQVSTISRAIPRGAKSVAPLCISGMHPAWSPFAPSDIALVKANFDGQVLMLNAADPVREQLLQLWAALDTVHGLLSQLSPQNIVQREIASSLLGVLRSETIYSR